MNEKYAKMLKDFKQFHSGNCTPNHREKDNSAQSRALSGIKKMSVKRLAQTTR